MPDRVRIVAIDPGTKCGYSYIDIPFPVPPTLKACRLQSGVWDLSVKRHEGGGMRFIRLRKHLMEIEPTFLLYEEVVRHMGTIAAHVYGGIVATMQTYCVDNDIQHIGIPVGTIKKKASGKGNCGKPVMVQTANEFFDMGDEPITEKQDDIADAMWLMQIGIDEWAPSIAQAAPRDAHEDTEA